MQSDAGLGNLLILALPLLLLGFLMWTQRRRARDIQRFQAGIAVGDAVVMTSGIYGQVVKLDGAVATVRIAPGVEVVTDRRAIGGKQPGDSAVPSSDVGGASFTTDGGSAKPSSDVGGASFTTDGGSVKPPTESGPTNFTGAN